MSLPPLLISLMLARSSCGCTRPGAMLPQAEIKGVSAFGNECDRPEGDQRDRRVHIPAFCVAALQPLTFALSLGIG